MNYPITREEVRGLRADRERVADLLRLYPEISGDDVQEILTFLRTGRHVDIGMLTSNQSLRPKLDAFMDEHRAHFRLKWGEGAAVVGGIVALLALVWLVWEALA